MAESYELIGTPLGQHPRSYPGLAPLAHKLSDLSKEIAQLEAQTWELKHIRATLLLNFGENSPHNVYGISVTEDLSTPEMLMVVLEQCCRFLPRKEQLEEKPELGAKNA